MRRLGNAYTASVFASLASLVSNKAADLKGKRAAVFSYGSGLASSFFALRFDADLEDMAQKMDLLKRLSATEVRPCQEFVDALKASHCIFSPALADLSLVDARAGTQLERLDTFWFNGIPRAEYLLPQAVRFQVQKDVWCCTSSVDHRCGLVISFSIGGQKSILLDIYILLALIHAIQIHTRTRLRRQSSHGSAAVLYSIHDQGTAVGIASHSPAFSIQHLHYTWQQDRHAVCAVSTGSGDNAKRPRIR